MKRPYLRRRLARLQLALVDAEVARALVDDGALSIAPLDGLALPGLRAKRLAAVRDLEAAGGVDPWPTVLRLPTLAQVEGHKKRSGR